MNGSYKKKTTLERFLLKRMSYYVLPNVLFNFIIAYASFQELGYTHFFVGSQSLARLTLPMAIFLPVVLTMDIIKRVIAAIEEERIELMVDESLNRKRFITKLCVLHGITMGVLLLIILMSCQYFFSAHYKLDALWMAIVDGFLAGILSVLFTYLPIRRLRKYLKPQQSD
ncbi:hypothetical protein HP439_11300 [Sphingobacterium shayense]|uniref:hypothetical protein n=1 Tax=Sphingobacterium shayense TaxID=626343 RepID=UPI0015539D8D|nr:hypothetical protein [Sphingobacterium shayense]NQD71306.1 hypothetical protein [Sphingobacterium shayense]